ncbi:hypothetical protein [Marmoricola sp. RAF53]|uniref:hypothetical protein n=1 Tax=Marmoricola sp. RAF53 TaxID=3233059 RepID=UPI003F943831
MYPSKDARELAILLRISRELDIVGDISATVDNPSEIVAWSNVLARPDIVAWRARDSGHRYLQVTADHRRAPVRGRITAVLHGEAHLRFWNALGLGELRPGDRQELTPRALSAAWSDMPLAPAETDVGEHALIDTSETSAQA